ncbi:hypothetical protein ACWEQA_35685, partial [Nocardia sp. NPDC004085]
TAAVSATSAVTTSDIKCHSLIGSYTVVFTVPFAVTDVWNVHEVLTAARDAVGRPPFTDVEVWAVEDSHLSVSAAGECRPTSIS